MLLKLNVLMNQLGILLRWGLWFIWCMVGPQILFLASSLVILLPLVHMRRQSARQRDYLSRRPEEDPEVIYLWLQESPRHKRKHFPFLFWFSTFGWLIEIQPTCFLHRWLLSISQVLNVETKGPDMLQISYCEKLHCRLWGLAPISHCIWGTCMCLSIQCPMQLTAEYFL